MVLQGSFLEPIGSVCPGEVWLGKGRWGSVGGSTGRHDDRASAVGRSGRVSFVQFFGSALQVMPHFHSLVPDGVFVPQEGGMRFEALPPLT
jgi:Putative transposase